jgi:hypothetical protein
MLPPMPHPLLLNAKDKLKGYSGVALSLIAQPMLVIGQVEGKPIPNYRVRNRVRNRFSVR